MSIEKFLVTKTPVIGNDAIFELRNHRLTPQLSREDNTFVWTVYGQKRMMGGLTKLIRRRFYPDAPEFKKKKHNNNRRIIASRGKTTGTRVHRQIYHMIVCVKLKSCDCKIKTNPKKLNVLTKQAFQVFKQLEFTPLDAEVMILSETARFCTQLDVIGYKWYGTSKQRSVIISIKTGYSDNFDKSKGNKMMLEPLNSLLSTAQNHNQLQGMLERYILKKEYGVHFDDYYIIYLGHKKDGSAHIETLAPWCTSEDMCEKVYSSLRSAPVVSSEETSSNGERRSSSSSSDSNDSEKKV